MPILQVYVDDRTLRTLQIVAERTARTVEDLAECAVQEATIRSPEWLETAEPTALKGRTP